jgi:signal transduction histidine kinase
MSHELRTPLNAIIGFSDVLLTEMFGELNAKQSDYLADILSSGQHLLSLINDILDLSKVEAGRMELECYPFLLANEIEGSVRMVRERATIHNIRIDVELLADIGIIHADQRKVKQILFNLLSNAVKFTPDGGRIAVTARRSEDAVEVAVADTGVGIAPENFALIFDEFRQVRPSMTRAHEGTGLGLALTKRLVELHGGCITLESTLGVGSTFRFTLPIHPSPGTEGWELGRKES